MSLYGYGRNTTPNLLKISDKLHVMRDACASHDNTLDALKHLLTFATDEEPEYLSKAPNLLQIMRAAGYETYWLSNQQEVTVGASYISVFSDSANHRDFVNHRALSEGVSLDEKLFEPLEKVLAHGPAKKFIIIHLIGAHAGYDLRYPRQYQIFDDAPVGPELAGKALSSGSARKKYNEYDNAILYSDYIAYQLIKLQHSNTPVSLTYISDHGESIDEKDGYFGHGLDLPYRANFEIPVFFWFSPVAEILYSQKIHNLENNLKRPFQEDQTIHTLLDMYGVGYPLVNRHYSLFNEHFDPKPRRCDRPAYQMSALDKINKERLRRTESAELVKSGVAGKSAKP
jgi:heptose-I-phosphate ethanolaminephosphotransferase